MPNTLIVFDLDFTLWNAGGTWCDHLRPPFNHRNGQVLDADGVCVDLYPDVLRILHWCDEQHTPMGLASRTGAPDWARQLLDLFEIRTRFQFEEIYPGNKTRHFRALQQATGLNYSNMVFFDDEYRNVHNVSDLGVHVTHVPQGLNWKLFQKAINSFHQI